MSKKVKEQKQAVSYFRVKSDGTGEIETTSFDDAVKDTSENSNGAFSAELAEQLLNDGGVIFSDTYYYSTNMDSLKEHSINGGESQDTSESQDTPEDVSPELEIVKDEYSQESDEQGEGQTLINVDASVFEAYSPNKEENVQEVENPVKEGDRLINESKNRYGVAQVNGVGELIAHFEIDGKAKQSTPNVFKQQWRKMTDEEITAFDENQNKLAKADEAIQGEVIIPLSDEESERYEFIKNEYRDGESIKESISFKQGRLLAEAKINKLFRVEYSNFETFVDKEFNLTRQHAETLVTMAGYKEIADEALQGVSEHVQISFNAMHSLSKNMNALTKDLDLDKATLNIIKPVIINSLRVFIDTVPKDAEGNLVITPRLVNSFNDIMLAHVVDNVIEIEGVQMTTREASEKGLLSASIQSEVLEATAQSILTNQDIIKSEAMTRYADKVKPIIHKDNPSRAIEYFKGNVPSMTIKLDKKDASIIAIANGTITMSDNSKWQIDAVSGELVCFEVEGLKVNLLAN